MDEEKEIHGAYAKVGAIKLQRDALLEKVKKLEDALREISKGEGRFSRDRLTHANNTIEDMKAIALNALKSPDKAEDKEPKESEVMDDGDMS